jgi:23S rRNA pseudouridine1911/1915/1917 synthase
VVAQPASSANSRADDSQAARRQVEYARLCFMIQAPEEKPTKYIGAQPGEPLDDEAEEGAAESGATQEPLQWVASVGHSGERLDKALATLLPQVSRSRIRQWIDAGAVQVNGRVVRPREMLVAGDVIDVQPQADAHDERLVAEKISLDIVFEDESITVLAKPAGLVVHPGAGNWSGTLANGLLAHHEGAAVLPRAGIVHRLDAETSGLMVVARTSAAYTHLVAQLAQRTVRREYWAVVVGEAPPRRTIDAAIGRDPRNPLRMHVSRSQSARPARTHLARVEKVQVGRATLSWVACRLETGRTHQIRVHMESIGLPLVGDPVYSRGRPSVAASARAEAAAWLRFGRQALHACRLGLEHPVSGRTMSWFRAPPEDLRQLMAESGFGRSDQPREVFE